MVTLGRRQAKGELGKEVQGIGEGDAETSEPRPGREGEQEQQPGGWLLSA